MGTSISNARDGYEDRKTGHWSGEGKNVPRRRWKSRNGSSQNLTSDHRPATYGMTTKRSAEKATTDKKDITYPFPPHSAQLSAVVMVAVALYSCHGESVRASRKRSQFRLGRC